MPVWDVVAGFAAVTGILAAERQRRATGEGQFIQLALSDTAFSTLSHLGYVAEAQVNGDERPRTGNHVYGTFGQDFPTRDGRRVMVTARSEEHTSELQSLMRISYAVFCLKKKTKKQQKKEHKLVVRNTEHQVTT